MKKTPFFVLPLVAMSLITLNSAWSDPVPESEPVLESPPSVDLMAARRARAARPPRTFGMQLNGAPYFVDYDGDGRANMLLMYGAALRLNNPSTAEFFSASFAKAEGTRLYQFNAEGAYEIKINEQPVFFNQVPHGDSTLIYAVRIMLRGEGRHNLLRTTITGLGEVALRNTFFGVTPEAVASITGLHGNLIVSGSMQFGPTFGIGRYASTGNEVHEAIGAEGAIVGYLQVKVNQNFRVSIMARDQIRLNFNPEHPIDGPLNSSTLMVRFDRALERNPLLSVYFGVGATHDRYSSDQNVTSIGDQRRETLFIFSGFEYVGEEFGARRARRRAE